MTEAKTIIFCPGCGRRKPAEEEKHVDYTCCNPLCLGNGVSDRAAGCYHCQSPEHWPGPLFRVVAIRKGRTITSLVRVPVDTNTDDRVRAEEHLKAAKQFNGKLSNMLLLQSGLRWKLHVSAMWDMNISERIYECYARGATILIEDRTGAPPQVSEMENEEPEVSLPIPTEEPISTVSAAEPKMTRDQAKEALEIYVRQQIEAEAINLLESLVEHIAYHAHELHRPNYRVSIGAIPMDQMYAEMLEHAQAMGLASPKPPEWTSSILGFIRQIRVERGIPKPAPPPEPKCHDLSPAQRAYHDPSRRW